MIEFTVNDALIYEDIVWREAISGRINMNVEFWMDVLVQRYGHVHRERGLSLMTWRYYNKYLWYAVMESHVSWVVTDFYLIILTE